MSLIGWAYDLKTVSHDVIQKRVKRTGDGSHPVWGHDSKDEIIENNEPIENVEDKLTNGHKD